MKQTQKTAFTLIELIVVITILAILGTIAFISLQGYSAQARDSKRLSDIQNIKKSLELFSLNTGKYPEPDDFFTVSYSGEIARYQGTIGNQVSTNLSRNLNKKPTDPLTGAEYIYATTQSQTEFEILGLYESELVSVLTPSLRLKGRLGWVNESNAASLDFPKIEGNYNGIYVKTPNFYVPTPSIINGNIWGNLDFFNDETLITSQVITGGDNIPGVSTGGLDITLSVYEGTLTSNSTDEEKSVLVGAIQTAYSGSSIASNTSYADILFRTSTGEMVDFVDLVVLKTAEYSIFASSGGGSSSGEEGGSSGGLGAIGTQEWIKTLGGVGNYDSVYAIASDTNGNIYVGGEYYTDYTNNLNVVDFEGNALSGHSTSSDGKSSGGLPLMESKDLFLAKFNSTGTQQWIKTFGGDFHEKITSLFVDSSGNIYVGGNYDNNLTNEKNVVDFGGSVLLGNTSSAWDDGFVAKLDSNGTQQWIKTFGGVNSDLVGEISVDNSGNVYIGGSYTNGAIDFEGNTIAMNSSYMNGFVAKLNNVGIQQWFKTIGGDQDDYLYGLSLDTSGNIYVGGWYSNDLSDTNNVIDFEGSKLVGKSSEDGRDDGFIAKLDINGNQQWIKTYGGSFIDKIYSIATDLNGNVYAGGYYVNDTLNTASTVDFGGNSLVGYSVFGDGYYGPNCLITKLDSNGNQQWVKSLGGEKNELYYGGLSTDINGNVYMGGMYFNDLNNTNNVVDFGGNTLLGKSYSLTYYDIFLAKLDNNGEQVWIKNMGGKKNEYVWGGLSTDINGNVYLGGKYHNNLSDTNNIYDFNEETLRGVTSTESMDAYILKIK